MARNSFSISTRIRMSLEDLAPDTSQEDELRRWRQRLMAHFEERGAPFLDRGRLGLRPKIQPRSPLFRV